MSKIYQKMYLTNKSRSKGVLGGFIHNAILKSFYSESHQLSFKRAGFTLIELLVVVLIIGILAAVALPQYEKAVEKSRAAEAMVLVRAIADAEERYYLANGEYAADIGKLDITFPGTSATYYVPGFETKNFICRPVRLDGGWNALAVCNRLPRETIYGIGKLKDGRMICGYYSEKGEEICKAMNVDVTGDANSSIFQ